MTLLKSPLLLWNIEIEKYMTKQELAFKIGMSLGKLDKIIDKIIYRNQFGFPHDSYLDEFKEVRKLILECSEYFYQDEN